MHCINNSHQVINTGEKHWRLITFYHILQSVHSNHKTSRVSCFGYFVNFMTRVLYCLSLRTESRYSHFQGLSLESMINHSFIGSTKCIVIGCLWSTYCTFQYCVTSGFHRFLLGLPSVRWCISDASGQGDVMTTLDCGSSRVELHAPALIFGSKNRLICASSW